MAPPITLNGDAAINAWLGKGLWECALIPGLCNKVTCSDAAGKDQECAKVSPILDPQNANYMHKNLTLQKHASIGADKKTIIFNPPVQPALKVEINPNFGK